LSNIELRLGLWLAAQEDKLDLVRSGSDLYKDFVAGVYHIAVEEVTKQQRQVGKVCQLSLIYGTGPAKLREALRIMGGVRMDLEEAKPLVAMYRGTYGGVVNAWREGDQALQAIANDQRMEMFRGTVVVEGRKGIRLPSGVHIQYPNLRRLLNPDTGKGEWVFDSKYGIERAYGSKVFQGVTQAVARCLMGVGLLRIQKFAPVRLTIHDSAYWLARREEADASLAMGVKALTDPVSFCPGLPLAAEGAWGVSLADC
jgi:DNA polymerase